MAGTASEDSGVGSSSEGLSSGQRCQSIEALAEWRSSEQVENGIPSTSPSYWDTDDDDDCGPKPSDLYGKHTWKIEKFSQITKRELRSSAFEVGGYKWYILIYPQGCDVCNHLSLFLCVANHDKLLPGWSHFAQFTIAVVNKDPKKSKYSDTLHRFWKKEHDWGWKKFMELSKVFDGFIDADTLIIKAQVQVIRRDPHGRTHCHVSMAAKQQMSVKDHLCDLGISHHEYGKGSSGTSLGFAISREKADRPFRCLDCQYRRELVRVYLTNVEQICRRFVEERRGKLGKLLDDKKRWSSFCSFWSGIDQNARRRMSREKSDMILKIIVKHFFIEKEVTSTLVMDSLYSGLKALEGQAKGKKGRAKPVDVEETPAPIVRVEKDSFVLVDDVLILLERAAMEPLPPKDDKGPQNRTKEGGSGEDFNKDSIERDERRLTELGRRTGEIFVLAHIFSNKIEVAYQEAVALKRQEELIREEEAWMGESEHKTKRSAAEREKKSKKKQAKQKKNNRRGKDKGRDERTEVVVQDKHQQESPIDEEDDFTAEQAQNHFEKADALEDVSDVSDAVDCTAEALHPDSEDRDASPVNWDTDASEVHLPTEASSGEVSGLSSVQNGKGEKKSPSVLDDSSSTCSTDSVPSVVMNGPYKGNSLPNNKNQKSPSRGKHQQYKVMSDQSSRVNEIDSSSSEPVTKVGHANDASADCKTADNNSDAVVLSLHERIKWLEQHVVKKDEEVVSLQKKLSIKDKADTERISKEKMSAAPSSSSPPRRVPTASPQKPDFSSATAGANSVLAGRATSNNLQQTNKVSPQILPSQNAVPQPDIQKASNAKPVERPTTQQVSRPSSAPLFPGPKQVAPVVSTAQTAPTPILARSVSAAGRMCPDPSPANHGYVPQSAAGRLGPEPSLANQIHVPHSYRNAIVGNTVTANSATLTQYQHSQSPSADPTSSFSPAVTSLSTLVQALNPSSSMASAFSSSVVPFSTLSQAANTSSLLSVSAFSQPVSPSPALSQAVNRSSTFSPSVNPPPTLAHAVNRSSSSFSAAVNPPPTLSQAVNQSSTALSSVVKPSPVFSQPGSSMFLSRSSDMMDSSLTNPSFSFGISARELPQARLQWMESPQRDAGRSTLRDTSLLTDIQNLDFHKPVFRGSQERFAAEFPASTSGRQHHSAFADEFPHLDIINDLLEDEQSVGNMGIESRVYSHVSNGHHHLLNRQSTFPRDVSLSGEASSSTSCRLDRTMGYHDNRLQRGYNSFSGPFESSRNLVSQINQAIPYVNGQVDGLTSNRWPTTSFELSMHSFRGTESDGYPYRVPDYANLASSLNGYS
ncbi:MATH/TRAF domain, partial [Dillenia turbinata]